MLFERCHTKNRMRSIKQHIKYFHFLSKIQLDHPVNITLSLMMGGYDPFLNMGWAYHPRENCSSLSLASTWEGSAGSRGSDHSPFSTIPTWPGVTEQRLSCNPAYIRNLIRDGRWKWSRWDLDPSQNGREAQHKAQNKQNLWNGWDFWYRGYIKFSVECGTTNIDSYLLNYCH